MTTTRHAEHPLKADQVIPTLCGRPTSVMSGTHVLASPGDSINCPECRVIINFVRQRITPGHYTCVRER